MCYNVCFIIFTIILCDVFDFSYNVNVSTKQYYVIRVEIITKMSI